MTHRPSTSTLTALLRTRLGLSPSSTARASKLRARRLLAPFAIAAMLLGLAGNANAQQLSFGIDPAIDDQVYTVGEAVNVTLLVATGGVTPITYNLTATDGSAQPPPIGLVFNPTNRTLIGTPSVAAAAVSYRWIVTDSASPAVSRMLDFTITVNAVVDTAPAFVAGAAIEAATFYQDTNITPLTLPRATGGEGAITYALTPAIPGMFFDTVTGVLTGAPTTAAAATTYTYTAGDTDGSAAGTDESSLTISITVLANTAPAFSVFRGPRFIFTVGTMVNQTLPVATGGDGAIVYTLGTRPLPAGLTFDGAATPPTISGIPTTAASSVTYRYNADDSDANESGDDGSSLSFRITIRGAAATGITMTIRDLDGDPITSLNEGDDPTTFRLYFDTVPALSGFTADQDVAITVSTPVAGQVGYTAAGVADFIDRDVASTESRQLQLTVTDDDVATADGVVTYTATVSPSGFTATAMITLVDNEISIVTTPSAVTLATGSTANYTVQLDQEPPGSVTVSVASVGDAIATVSRNTRVFTAANWNVPASVTVTGMRGGSTTISHSATAAGGFGYPSTDVMVTVTPVAVNFDADTLVLDQTFQMGTAVDLTLPTATGATTYRLSSHADQSLPAGLTFDGATRVLSGIPTATQTAEGYVYSARNPDNLDNLNFDITVEATGTPTTAPSSQTLSLNPTAVTESATPTDITATVTLTGGAYTVARSFSIGSSSGTATEGTDYTALSNVVLTIPANAASGTVTFPFTAADDMTVEGGGESLNIRSTLLIVAGTDPDTSLAVANAIISISDPAAADTAPAFADGTTVAAQTFTIGTAVDLTLPEATGGEDGIVYTLSTALPAGLTFNSGTRVLDGTPTAVATAATYFYRAADGDGNNMPSDSVLLTFTITVSADTAPAFADGAAIEAQTYAALTAIMPLTLPTATGGNGAITYTLTPAIPGLTLDAATGVLTGMPTTEATATTYTYTAADGDGNTAAGDEVSLTFSLTVTEAIPTGVVMSVNPTMVMESATPTAVMLTATVTGGTFNVARVVRWRINDGTASQFTDYTRIGNTDLTIPANMVSGTATFMFTAHVDTVAEPAGETVRIEGGVLNIAQTGTDSLLSFTPAILTINDPAAGDTAPSFGTETVADLLYTIGTPVAFTFPAATGGNAPLTYSLTPAILGLTFDPATRVLSGMPTGAVESTHTYTVTDADDDSDDLIFDIVVETDATPSFGVSFITDEAYTTSTVVELTLPAATGGNGALTYSLTPAIAGLAFDPATRILSGTPTNIGDTSFTYVVTDGDGNTMSADTDTLSLDIMVTMGAPAVQPTFLQLISTVLGGAEGVTALATPTTFLATAGSETIVLTLSGPDAALFSITQGGALSFRTAPDFEMPRGMAPSGTNTNTYMVTVTATASGGGTRDAILTVTVTDVDETPDPGTDTSPAFANGARIPTQDFTVGVRIASLSLPQATGGDGTLTYTLTPALSAGLTFDGTARTITGTPTTAATLVTYRYTATDMDGDTATLTFRVTVVASTGPSFGGASVSDQFYAQGTAITPLTLPVATGGSGTSTYTLTPALPTGLSFTAADRTITGTASTVAGATAYTYTVTDTNSDSASLMFSITVEANTAPDFGTTTPFVPTGTIAQNRMITPITLPAATGGNGPIIYTLAASPALPTGLTLDAATGVISGTPTTVVAEMDYTYTAADSDGDTTPGDEDTLVVRFEVIQAPPTSIDLSVDPATVTESSAATMITVTATLIDGTFTAERRITLSASDDSTATVTTDYTPAITHTITIPASMTSATVTIPFTATVDTLAEAGGETVIIGRNLATAGGTAAVSRDIPITPATLTINDYTPVTVDAGGDRSVTYGSTFMLNGTVPTSFTNIAAAWTLSNGAAARTALMTAGLTMTDAQMEVTRLTAALATMTTLGATLTAPTADPQLTDPVPLEFTITVTDNDAPAGQSVTMATDTVTITVVEAPNTVVTTTLNQMILPEVTRALLNSTAGSITQRIEQAATDTEDATMTLNGRALSLTTLANAGSFAEALNSPGVAETLTAAARGLADGSWQPAQLFGNSSFVLPLNAGGGLVNRLMIWGRGDYRNVSGKSNGLDWDGDLISGRVGADAQITDTLLAGLAVSRQGGAFDYTGADTLRGTYNIDQTSIHPYLGWSAPDGRRDAWITLGYGWGEVEIDDQSEDGQGQQTADLTTRTIGGGGSAMMLESGVGTLRLKGEILQTRADVDGNADAIAEMNVDASRIRVMVEGTHKHELDNGAILRPTVEVGLRHDAGDGRTGTGAEIGGSLRFTHPAQRLMLEGRWRVLVAHSGDYGDWGVSGTVRFEPGVGGRGLAVSLQPSYGATANRVAALWAQETAVGTTASAATPRDSQMNVTVSYGLDWADGMLTPYSRLLLTDAQTQAYRIGSRLQMSDGLAFNLEGLRQQTAAQPVDHGIMLKLQLDW